MPQHKNLFALPFLSALLLLVSWVPAAAQPTTQRSLRSLIAAWRLDSSGSTDTFIYFDSTDGRGFLVDRLTRNPQQLRRQLLSENLFGVMGRPENQPALAGEVQLLPLHSANGSVRSAVLVETSTGYLAYFDAFARKQKLGQMITTIGRPFSRLAAVDGAFALLPRRARNGRTEAIYLYHAPTGGCLMVTDIYNLSTEPGVTQVVDLPTMSRIAAVSLEGASGTRGFLLVDQAGGRLFFLDIDPAAPARPTARRSPLALTRLFPESLNDTADQRFLPIPLQGGGKTLSVLLIHTPSGALGLLDGLSDDAPPSLVPLTANLSAVLAPSEEPRQLTAIPRLVSGTTRGVWLLDAASGSLAYIDSPLTPTELRVGRVRFETN